MSKMAASVAAWSSYNWLVLRLRIYLDICKAPLSGIGLYHSI